MSTAPSQSYKTSAYMEPGGGVHGGSGAENPSQSAYTAGNSAGATASGETSGPQQEVAGTLPTDFTLSNTKAEVKGEERQPVYSHDIDMPKNKPHLAAQSNESSKTPFKKPTDDGVRDTDAP